MPDTFAHYERHKKTFEENLAEEAQKVADEASKTAQAAGDKAKTAHRTAEEALANAQAASDAAAEALAKAANTLDRLNRESLELEKRLGAVRTRVQKLEDTTLAVSAGEMVSTHRHEFAVSYDDNKPRSELAE